MSQLNELLKEVEITLKQFQNSLSQAALTNRDPVMATQFSRHISHLEDLLARCRCQRGGLVPELGMSDVKLTRRHLTAFLVGLEGFADSPVTVKVSNPKNYPLDEVFHVNVEGYSQKPNLTEIRATVPTPAALRRK